MHRRKVKPNSAPFDSAGLAAWVTTSPQYETQCTAWLKRHATSRITGGKWLMAFLILKFGSVGALLK